MTVSAALVATCMLVTAETYAPVVGIPPQQFLVGMLAIMEVEGGRDGQAVPNYDKDGRVRSEDLGRMQVNTHWIPDLARTWGMDYKAAYNRVKDDACTNVAVGGYVLHKKIIMANGDLAKGIAYYNNVRPEIHTRYLQRVLKAIHRQQRVASR